MTLEQLQFCLDTVKKGDELYVAYETDFRYKEFEDPKIVTRQDISHIIELLTVPKKDKEHRPYGFFTIEEDAERTPILLRKHRNKYYDVYGNRVTVW